MPNGQSHAVRNLLMKKSGQALSFLAGEFLKLDTGERVFTFSQLAEQSPFTRGTLQNAMRGLEDIGAIELIKRGQLGTFLVEKNTALLLDCLGIRYITGTMPLPYTKVYEGLATGLFHTIPKHSGVAVDIAYMRGSEKRIQSVLGGRYDFAVTSRLAANAALDAGYKIEIIKDFGPRSYLTGHIIAFREAGATAITSGMRVGVDTASLDHVRLTHTAIGGADVIIKNINYNQILTLIDNNEIDAAVWNIDNILESHTAVNYKAFGFGSGGDESIAVMVVAAENCTMKSVIDEFFDIESVLEQQRLVMAGEIYPNY